MENKKVLELIAKKIGKSATPEELADLAAFLASNPDYAYLYEIVHSLKGGDSHYEKSIPKEELVNHGWKHLADKMSENPGFIVEMRASQKKSLFRQIFFTNKKWVAAALIFGLFISSVLIYRKSIYNKSTLPSLSKIVEVHYGNTSKIVLADGSKVWLNAGSRLTYPDTFSNSIREVSLIGEAFFEVTKNPNSPFLVHAGKITVRVLGTKFNVKAYNEDPDIETTLISGKVQVMLNDDPEKKIILSPHEKLTVINPSKNNTSKPVDEITSNELRYQVQALPADSNNNFVETAWLDNKLVFSNENFENVARLLERKYNVHIHFGNSKLKQERITGIFEKENVSQVLEVLKMTTRFKYSVDGNTIQLF